MQKTLAYFVFICMIMCGAFLTLFPYPTFYSGTQLISKTDISKINDFNENENYDTQNIIRAPEPKLCKLDWFECADALMPYNSPLQVVDVKSGIVFYVSRIGGTLHADVKAFEQEDEKIIENFFEFDSSNKKRSVIIQLQPSIWSAASLCTKAQVSSSGQKHYCLYFNSSRAHSTKLSDIEHQKAIDNAYKSGKDYL